MSIELWCLWGAAVLGLVHVSAQSFAFKGQAGNAYTVGARDEPLPATGLAGRFERALRNFLETFPLFAAAILIVHVTDTGGWFSYWGAQVYLGGRVLYLPLYALGVPWLRTFAWNIATAGLVMVLIEAVL